MPRPASALWAHFRKDPANKRAICKYCQHNMCGLVTRMRQHLARKCPECPAHIKNEMFDVDLNRKMELTSMAAVTAAAAAAGNATVGGVPGGVGVGVGSPGVTGTGAHHGNSQHAAAAALVAANAVAVGGQPGAGTGVGGAPGGVGSANAQLMHGHAGAGGGHGGPPLKKQRRSRLQAANSTSNTVSMDEKNDLDSYVAKAILGAGLPVSCVENPSFVKLIKRLNPHYDLPTAFTMATTCLDLEYTEVQLKLRGEVLDATSVCLGVESWSQLMQKSIISCMINTPNPGVFAFENTGELAHTTEVLVQKIENIMTQIGTGKVSVIVTDTSANMKDACLVLEGKYPEITFLPSCSHATNAMMTEILNLPQIANLLNVCKQITKHFCQDHLARAAFARVSEQMQGLEASYPISEPDTTPSSLLECLFGVERNRHSFDILLAENNSLEGLENQAIKEQILNLSFWEEISTLTSMLEPFLDMLKTFDSDYPLLSTFYHRFTLIWSHLEKYGPIATNVNQIMTKHWQSLRHPAMYTAYLLDPRFPPSNLSEEATSEVLAYLKRSTDSNIFASIVSELTRFTGRVGMFADEAIWESAQKCSPIHWWKGFIGSSCPNLQAVALRTLCFPAASGLSKSRRDMFERIHAINSKYMNDEQASKAALVYLNTNLASAIEDGVANEQIV